MDRSQASTEERKVIIELCHENSLGNQWYPARIVEWQRYTPDEAAELLARKTVNGFFYRVKEQE